MSDFKSVLQRIKQRREGEDRVAARIKQLEGESKTPPKSRPRLKLRSMMR